MTGLLRFTSAVCSAASAVLLALAMLLMLAVARADEPLAGPDNSFDCGTLASCTKDADGSCDTTGAGSSCVAEIGCFCSEAQNCSCRHS